MIEISLQCMQADASALQRTMLIFRKSVYRPIAQTLLRLVHTADKTVLSRLDPVSSAVWTHYWRRDETVLSCRVGGVNTHNCRQAMTTQDSFVSCASVVWTNYLYDVLLYYYSAIPVSLVNKDFQIMLSYNNVLIVTKISSL